MAKDSVDQGRRFSDAMTPDQLASALAETPELFQLVIDTDGLSAVNLPDGFVAIRYAIVEGDLFLIGPDGQIIALLAGAQNTFILQFDGIPVAATALTASVEALGAWDQLGDIPQMTLDQMLDLGDARPGTGEQEPVRVGDPLTGLEYNPLLPPTEYPPEIEIQRRFFGGDQFDGDNDGVPEPGVNTIDLTGQPVAYETDAPVDLRPASFIEFNLEQADIGESVSQVTLQITGLPLGTTTNLGQIVNVGGVATLNFTGSEDDFNALLLTFPTDFSTESRNDTPEGPLQATISIETTFLGSAQLDFPIEVFAEGDAVIDDTGPDNVVDETDAPTSVKPSDLLAPQVTDIDGSEDYEMLELIVEGLPAGSTLASLGLVVPAGAVAALSPALNGSTTLTITMTAGQVADTQAAYDSLELTLPTDFSTESRTDLRFAGDLPLTLTLNIQTDEDVSAATDTPNDGTVTATRVVDIGAEGDLQLSGPGTLTLDENDAPGDTDEDNTPSTPLDVRPADAVTGQPTDIDGSESIANVDVSINGLPAGTEYSTDGGTTFQTAPAGAVFTLNGLTFAEYQDLIIRLPDDFSTTTPLTGSATFTTDEAILAGEVDTGPNDGVETGTFTITVNSEQDVEITSNDITVIEDLDTPIPLNVDVAITDIDGSESITSLTLDFANLPAGNTVLSDGTALNAGNTQWTGNLATLQSLAVTSLPTHYSGVITITVTVDTDEGDPTVATETFDLNVTPVAEPTIDLSVDDSVANVGLRGPDNYLVDEDTSFLLLIDAGTPDQDGSEALTQIVIENIPTGWITDTGGVVDPVLIELGGAQVASATISGTTLTITLVGGVTQFDGGIRMTPLPDDDRDVATIVGNDLTATVTSVDQAPSLPSDMQTATDSVDVDVDAIVDGLIGTTNDITVNENRNGRRALDVNISGTLEDNDGSETISALDLTITVATESTGFDPSDPAQLELRVSDPTLAGFVVITQTGSTANSVSYSFTPAAGATQAQFTSALESLETVVPQHFSGVLTLDGTVAWNETTTGDVEDDLTDNFNTGVFQITQTVNPVAEADLAASVFVLTAAEVATGSTTSVSASVQDGSVSGSQILTLLESTADGSGPGQVNLFVGLDAETPDTDGSEELSTLVVANVPTDWIANYLTGNTVDPNAFFAADGLSPLDPVELAKIDTAIYDPTTGELTLTFVPDVTSFEGSIQLTPTLYEDYDVDRNNSDPFTSAGDFFGNDLTITLTTQDDNTATTDTQASDATFDVDVDPVNNFAVILTLPPGNEGVIDAAGGVWQVPFDPVIQDQDGSEEVTAVVLRNVPAAITVYVPDPNDPTGPKVLALLTEVNTPPGFNTWSLENGGWTGAEVRGIPLHFAGPFGATIEVVTTEADGGGTRVTPLSNQLYIDPVVDGGDPSENYTTPEDTAVFFPLDGNLIDNPTNSPESPEAILNVVILSNIIPDSGGRVPQFFDGRPGDPTSVELFPVFAGPSGSLDLTVAQAANLWVLPGPDSNEDFVFDVSLIYYETLDLSQVQVATGTATLNVTGVADDPIITTQDETGYSGAIDAEFIPGGTTDGRPNTELVYGYAGFSNAPFLLDSRLQDGVIQNGVSSDQQNLTFTTNSVVPLTGTMTEILVPVGGPAADFDGSETIYYLITGVDPATSFANATPLDATGESYLVTESQLANLQFVPADVAAVTFYNLTFTAIVTEDDAVLPDFTGLTTAEIIQAIDALPGGAAVSEDISVVVVPFPGGGSGGGGCTTAQQLPIPTLQLIGSGDEDTEIAFQIQITPVPGFYDSIDDLVNLPNGVTGSFGLGIDLPPGSSISSNPPGAVLFDPVTGQYAIDLSVLGVDPTDPTLTAGSILFTPPAHESSPDPFPPSDTFGPDDPYDGLNSLDYSTILVNSTCGTTTSANGSFAITINPVVDGPEIVVLGSDSVLEDTAYLPNIEIRGIDLGERPVGNITIVVDGTNGGQLLDGAGNPLPGTPVGGGRIEYTVTAAQLPTLQITANPHYSGPLEYTVTATSEDLDGSTLSNTITQTLMIVPVADDPFFVFDQTPFDPDTGNPFVDLSGPTPVITIIEDIPFALGNVVDAGSPDQDGSEVVTLVLSGVPDYLIVTGPASGFIDNGDGTYTIAESAFDQVQFVLQDQHGRTPDSLNSSIPDEIPLTLTVNTLEVANSDSNTGSIDFIIRVRPDADVPTVTATIAPNTGVEDDGTVYTLDISGTTPDPHETMQFEITVPPGGQIYLDGFLQPAVGGVVTLTGVPGASTGGGSTFVPSGVVTFEPLADFAGDIALGVVAVTTDTALVGGFTDSESSASAPLTLTITPSLDLDLKVDPDPDAVAQTGAPISIELGIDAQVTETLGLETLDQVVVTFNAPLPAGTIASDGVLSADRQTLTLTRGALTSAEFTTLLAAVTLLLPGTFAGAVDGSVVATTNHGTSSPVPFSFDVNDQPVVSGPVDVSSTDPTFFITNGELLANASDMDALNIANVTSDDPTNVTVSVQAGGVQITVPDGFVGTPVLSYDIVDNGTPPASAAATANLDIDTLQMEATGTTITDPGGAPRDLLDDVTGAVGGNDIAKGTAGNDGVVLSNTSPYAEIEGFSLLGGDDFVDLSASSDGYSVDLGQGDDWVIGSGGNDTLTGGTGADTLEGGAGADIFVMTDLTMSDVITDYDGPAGGDQIDLTALVSVDPGNLGTEVTYDNTTGALDVAGTLVATVNASGGGFSAQVEVIFNDAGGAQQTAVI
ncbi:hypothetical protein GS636_06780 [Ruegeria sp. HKCCD4884]|uniref:cadherin-like domain-containing protein n=1 Tax=Ruegeria sp. HKCCD4884 TaxID=2683022 RepID=UPI001490D8E2|nr:cadherin-like domain-containing protein [Ruegeria sp. HKCCD4884]NOD92486.1 hypothetical protein [Ruegeria sp. HKCCD4884]